MCGVIGYLSNSQKDIFTILFQSLQMILNRGYDSVGIAGIKNDIIVNRKHANYFQSNSLELLKKYNHDFDGSQIGIGHTRWATHGGKTDANAHPHLDCKQRFALVHNGIIFNYLELKKFLLENNYTFQSETDSEVIVNLISYFYDQTQNIDLAINKTIEKLEGTWALIIITILQPDTLYLSKNGSPLLLGFNDTEIMVASEVSGFSNNIKQYLILDNYDFISVNFDNVSKMVINRCKNIHTLTKNIVESLPEPYKYWMLKEIDEQPQSLLRALNYGGRIESSTCVKLGGLAQYSERLLKIENLVIMACGTSFYAGLVCLQWLRKLQCFNTVTIIDASEFKLSDLPHNNAGVLVFSQSGETMDIIRSIILIKSTDVPIISVVNVIDSYISREADCGIYLNANKEVSVASTKSFTSQCAVGILISIWFSQNRSVSIRQRESLIKSLSSLSFHCENIINIHKPQCQEIAKLLLDKNHCFILGRDLLYPIAMEGALKLKEIGQIHAEGYCGGALKHGPFALIDKFIPVIILSNLESQLQMASTIEEIKSRDGFVIVISNHPINKKLVDYHVEISCDSELISILYTLIFQLTSYYLSLLKGNNPDYPRNLAKVVTVDG